MTGWLPQVHPARQRGRSSSRGGVPDFSALSFTVNTSRFLIGDFINVLLSCMILDVVVYYFVVVPIGRLLDRFSPVRP
jgi:hypothetical protein